MNWYIEKDGVSQGPVTEQVLALRVQGGEVPADTLIWQVGMLEWQPIQQLRPQWLQAVAPPPESAPVVEPAAPVAATEAKPAPATRTAAKPLAPSVQEEQPGFFKKLFGRGKKKT